MSAANSSDVRKAVAASEPSRSEALYRRALQVMPGGCSRNVILRKPHPLYAVSGRGCHVIDVEGRTWLDFANNMGSQIHGHAPAAVIAAVHRQLGDGTAFSMGTEAEIRYAEYMCQRMPNADRIRFCNSGTEAVMCAIKAARAFTGRPKIAKVEGAYHGLYDYAEVSQTAAPNTWGAVERPASVPVASGTPASALAEVVVVPFNDTARALAILEAHSADLAGIVIDLIPHRVGVIPAEEGFVNALGAWAARNGALLICDEVITFRTTYSGAQQRYAVRPDLTALGKMIGGGFPVGAIAGREEVMRVFDPLVSPIRLPHSGTFSANPITMVAGLAAMEQFDQQAVDRLNALSDRARSQLREAIATANTAACITGAGSMFRIHMKESPPENYRSAYPTAAESELLNRLIGHLEEKGILLINTGTGMLSTAMGPAEIDRLSDATLEALRQL